MTILVSIFGMAGRLAGDLLTSALGWASSLLFGRVPRSHQIFLTLMMAGSFAWLVMLLALVLPTVGSLLLSATPHPPFVNQAWLGFALLVAVVVLPLGVGLAGFLVPAEEDRRAGTALPIELLRGYLLTPLIGGLLIFLAGVGMQRKIRSKRHGWSVDHVPIVVNPGGYDQMVTDLHEGLEMAALPTAVEEAPRVLTLPAWLLTRVAGSNVRRLRPDRLMTLTGPDLNIGLYPSDIAIAGTTRMRTGARAAILGRLATTSAHQTTSAEAQEVEDRLLRLARAGETAGQLSRDETRVAFEVIDSTMLELEIPTDEWDILFRLRLQLERDLLLGEEPSTAFAGTAAHGNVPDSGENGSSVGSAAADDVAQRQRERGGSRIDPAPRIVA